MLCRVKVTYNVKMKIILFLNQNGIKFYWKVLSEVETENSNWSGENKKIV